MKLDRVEDINEYHDSVIRIWDFSRDDLAALVDAFSEIVSGATSQLELRTRTRLENVDGTQLIIAVSDVDKGVVTGEQPDIFWCRLTSHTWMQNITSIQHLMENDFTRGYHWLHNCNVPYELLLSFSGKW